MLSDLLTGQRLRFPIDLAEDESIPGAIAKGVREHVLVATRPVFEAAGVALRHVGLAQLATPQELERLAYVIRCDAQDLVDRAGIRIEEPTGKTNTRAAFGPLTMPRAFLELDRRRIGPKSLLVRGHHRLHWMNLLLPYCAESLESLVDTCVHCETSLGWRFARGIGNCDMCGEIVRPSEAPGMPPDLADGYRLFARLSSPQATAVADARASLPPILQSVSPDGLVNLALQLGTIVTGDAESAFSRTSFLAMSPPTLGAVASKGGELLRTFPVGLQDWVREADEGFAENIAATAKLRTRFRFLIGKNAHVEIPALIAHALPNIARYASHGLVATNRYYLYTDVRRILTLDNDQMAKFKAIPEVVARHLSAPAKRQLTQYDADYIDGLATIIRGATPARPLRRRLRLPLYAIEQLCIEQLLEPETHFILGVASSHLNVRAGSVDHLVSRIRTAAAREMAPSDCIKLLLAADCIGGGPKPWAGIVEAMLHGEIPFWLIGRGENFRDIKVRPGDLARFRRAPVELRKLPGGVCQDFCQEDAAEILNIKVSDFVRISKDIGLCPQMSGRRQASPRSDLLKVASCVAWPGEIAWRLGVKPQKIRGLMRDEGIAPISTGWDRKQLQKVGLLPT